MTQNTTLAAAMIDADLALANWTKYSVNPSEEAYQAGKVATALKAILSALRHSAGDAERDRLKSAVKVGAAMEAAHRDTFALASRPTEAPNP